MEKIIAYCGLVCSDCDAYVATRANDWEALERLAAKAREEFNMPDATAENAMCDGCLGDGGRKIVYCAQCEVRACAVGRAVANCGHCDDYACDKLESFFGMAPDARGTLDAIRAGLAA